MLVILQRKIDFITAVSGLNGIGRDKVEKMAGPFDGPGLLFSPLLTRSDALVVPDIAALLLEPLQFRIDEIRIRMCVTHENIGLITLVGGEGSWGARIYHTLIHTFGG